MEYHPFRLTSSGAGSSFALRVSCAYLRYHSISVGEDYPQIRIKSEKHDFLLSPGQSVQFPQTENFIVSNYDAQNSITGVLQIAGEDELISDGRVFGTVSVKDDSVAVSRRSASFASTLFVAAAAAKYSAAQIISTTKRLIVRKMSVGAGTANVQSWAGITPASLSTVATEPAICTKMSVISMPIAGGLLYSEQLSSVPTSPTFKKMHAFLSRSGYVVDEWKPERPLILPIGTSLAVFSDSVNTAFWTNWEWDEETDD